MMISNHTFFICKSYNSIYKLIRIVNNLILPKSNVIYIEKSMNYGKQGISYVKN